MNRILSLFYKNKIYTAIEISKASGIPLSKVNGCLRSLHKQDRIIKTGLARRSRKQTWGGYRMPNHWIPGGGTP